MTNAEQQGDTSVRKIQNKGSILGKVQSQGCITGKVQIPQIIYKDSGVGTPATTEELGLIKVGDNLTITEDGTLSVDVTSEAEADNTRPITSAAVNTLIGNIDALLSTI